MKINDDGLNLIKTYEGFRSKPYLCPAGVPTIGYGCTEYADGRRVSLSDREITEKEATTYLKLFVTTLEYEIAKLITVPLNQNQFSALVSFTYNLGLGSLRKSTLLKLLNEGKFQEAADQFLRWNKAGGKELPGLTKRREANFVPEGRATSRRTID
jgi:lysozyme